MNRDGYLRFSVTRGRQVSQPVGGRGACGAAKSFPTLRLGGSFALPTNSGIGKLAGKPKTYSSYWGSTPVVSTNCILHLSTQAGGAAWQTHDQQRQSFCQVVATNPRDSGWGAASILLGSGRRPVRDNGLPTRSRLPAGESLRQCFPGARRPPLCRPIQRPSEHRVRLNPRIGRLHANGPIPRLGLPARPVSPGDCTNPAN